PRPSSSMSMTQSRARSCVPTRSVGTRLRPNASLHRNRCYTLDGHRQCRCTKVNSRERFVPRRPCSGSPACHARRLHLCQNSVDLSLLAYHGVGRSFHLCLQLLIHLFQTPLFILNVLHPLEVADRDAPRIDQDVRQDRNTSLKQDLIGGWCCRSISPFCDE